MISYDPVESFADDGSVLVDRSSTRSTIDGLEQFVSYDITVLVVYDGIRVPAIAERVMTWSDGK